MPKNTLAPLVVKLSHHAVLSAADEAALRQMPVTTRWVEPGSYVVREGDRPTDCAMLIEGSACRHKLTMDGERQIVSIQIPGDPLDFQQLGDATGLTSVHVNRMLRTLEADGLLKRSGRVIAFANAKTLREVADFNSRYLDFGRQHTSEGKVAAQIPGG